MALPNAEEFMRSLLTIRSDCLASIAEAESRGDLDEARKFQQLLAKINTMIERQGGDPSA